MFVKTLLKYKWFVMCSIVMTGLMIASSLLQPWLLKQVLDALQMSDSKAIYQAGAWLVDVYKRQLYFLNKRRPSSTIRTATQILGRMIFTILTDKGRFFLSDEISPLYF